MIEETLQGWVVWTNTDLTEGRGEQYPLYVCTSPSTANRLKAGEGVMGSDADVIPCELKRYKNGWHGPVRLHHPTKEDMESDNILKKREYAVKRAKELGLTEEDLAALSYLKV